MKKEELKNWRKDLLKRMKTIMSIPWYKRFWMKNEKMALHREYESFKQLDNKQNNGIK